MKTISMDYEIYKKELNDADNRGETRVLRAVLSAFRTKDFQPPSWFSGDRLKLWMEAFPSPEGEKE